MYVYVVLGSKQGIWFMVEGDLPKAHGGYRRKLRSSQDRRILLWNWKPNHMHKAGEREYDWDMMISERESVCVLRTTP